MINVADIVQNDIADLFTLGVIDVDDEEAMEVGEVSRLTNPDPNPQFCSS